LLIGFGWIFGQGQGGGSAGPQEWQMPMTVVVACLDEILRIGSVFPGRGQERILTAHRWLYREILYIIIEDDLHWNLTHRLFAAVRIPNQPTLHSSHSAFPAFSHNSSILPICDMNLKPSQSQSTHKSSISLSSSPRASAGWLNAGGSHPLSGEVEMSPRSAHSCSIRREDELQAGSEWSPLHSYSSSRISCPSD
jgi:hypothetical protein